MAQFKNKTYNNNKTNEEDEMIIPPQLFEIPKKILFLQLPFSDTNRKTSEKLKLIIRWKTRNLKCICPVKDKVTSAFLKILSPTNMYG